MICKNCGAKFDEKEPKCPFCGFFNYVGSEKKYQEELSSIHVHMAELKEEPIKEVKNQVKKVVKIMIWVFIIIFGFFLLLTGLVQFFEKFDRYNYYDDAEAMKEKIIWKYENYMQLDTWYEEENYDAILQFESELYSNKIYYSLYDWQHYDFLTCWEEYMSFLTYKEDIESGGDVSFYQERMIYLIVYFYGPVIEADYTADEWERLEVYRNEILEYAFTCLAFTEEELQKLYEEANHDGYIDSSICYDYLEQMEERFQR